MTSVEPEASNRQELSPDGPSRPNRVGLGRLLTFLLLPTLSTYAFFQGTQQILLPTQIEAIDAASKVANLSVITLITSVATVIGLVAGGAVSDRTRGRFGRRAPWVLVSGIVGAGAVFALGLTNGLVSLAVTYVFANFVVAFMQAVLAAVLPDRVPESRRGIGSAILGLGSPLGIFVGVLTVAQMSIPAGYAFLGACLAVTAVLFVVFARDKPYNEVVATKGERTSGLRQVGDFLSGFRSRDFTLAFISRALMFLGFFTVYGYLFFILQDYVGEDAIPGGDVATAVSVLVVASTLAWIVIVPLMGFLADRIQRRKAFVGIAGLGAAAVMIVPIVAPTWIGILVFTIGLGIFFGTYLSVDLAVMSLVLPKGQSAGRDLALLTVATSAPQIIAPALAGGVILTLGYAPLFVVGAVCSVLGAVVIFGVRSVR